MKKSFFWLKFKFKSVDSDQKIFDNFSHQNLKVNEPSYRSLVSLNSTLKFLLSIDFSYKFQFTSNSFSNFSSRIHTSNRHLCLRCTEPAAFETLVEILRIFLIIPVFVYLFFIFSQFFFFKLNSRNRLFLWAVTQYFGVLSIYDIDILCGDKKMRKQNDALSLNFNEIHWYVWCVDFLIIFFYKFL